MNKIAIVLVALLAAAGCSKKGSGGADCDGAIAKGIEAYKAEMKTRAPNPQILERMMGVLDKVGSTLVQRCKEDSWSPEALACFSTAVNNAAMKGCQANLTPEQSSKLQGQLTQVMMGAGGMRPGGGMPAGHPPALAPNNGSAAPGAPAAGAPAAGAPAAPAAGAPAEPPAAGTGSAAK